MYTDEFKAELDSRFEEYKNGGKLVSEEEAKGRIRAIINKGKGKKAQYRNKVDQSFIEELDRRTKSFEDGTAKMYTWEETKQMARDRVETKKESL